MAAAGKPQSADVQQRNFDDKSRTGDALEATGVSPEAALPQRRPLTGGAVMSATSRISVAVTGAAATIVVARLLGPPGAGAYAVAQTVILLLTVLTTLGVEHGIAYYVSSGNWNAASAYRSSQWFAFVAGLLGAAVGLLVRLAVPQIFHGLSLGATLAAVLALPFALSWLYGTYVALAVDDYENYVLPPAIQSGLALCLVAALATLDGVRGAVVGFAAAHVLTALGMLAVHLRAKPPRHPSAEPAPSEDPHPLRRAVAFGIKGYASNALQLVNYRLDLLILNASALAADVGHYSVAVAVTGVMWLLPQALSDVLFPRIATLSAQEGESGHDMRAFVEAKSLRHTTIVTLATTALLAVALVTLVVPVYGPAFKAATGLGLILLPGVALLGLCGPLSASIVGRGRPDLSLAVTLIVTPVTVVLYLTLIPALHATGAALASTLSYAGTFLLVAILYRRLTGRPVLAQMAPTRSELADYRALGPAIHGWASNLRFGRG